LLDPKSPLAAQEMTLRVMSRAKLGKPPTKWRDALSQVIAPTDRTLLPLAIEAARKWPVSKSPDDRLNLALAAVADSEEASRDLRVAALAVIAGSLGELSEPQFKLLVATLPADNSVVARSAAVDAITSAALTPTQLDTLCSAIPSAGPLELNRLIIAFARSTDQHLGLKLLTSLRSAEALESLRMDIVRSSLSKYGADVQKGVGELEALVNVDSAEQRRRIDELLPRMKSGDGRRGHAVFHSTKATCSACHRMGAAGGTVGPELSKVGEIRTERDLLESILFPSLSFVQSYEPVVVVTVDGRTINGRIVEESDKELVIATAPNQESRLARDDVESIEPSQVSVMPGGLEGQLSIEELADLVAFLKNPTGK